MARIITFTKILILLAATCYPLFGIGDDTFGNVKDKDKQQIAKPRKNSSQRLIAEAYTWLGVVELTGNNDHPRISESMELCGLTGDKGYPWCASSQAQIHFNANIPAPHSARVVDWFKGNVIWKREWGEKMFAVQPGMVGAIYYNRLGRYGHIVMIVARDKNNYYTLEGNTNAAGSREGQGFYKKIRSKRSIAAIADYCLNGKLFIDQYEDLLKRTMK
ncbi:MAG: hypothetical protein HQ522_00515 [Bacteroidetes bacterium]|nr:hypothetical protein [Bacteroidota bacterium]